MMLENERPTSRCWDDARSIKDLGWMTIAWLLGDVDTIPINMGPPATVTIELIPSLEVMNGLGFVSTFSQPGRHDRSGSQRASLDAFGESAIVGHVAQACEKAGLYVKVVPLRKRASVCDIPITINGNGIPHTWAGQPMSTGELMPHFQCRSDLRQELAAALSISVIDFEWGRRDLLWHSVLEGLRSWVRSDRSELPRTVSTRGLVRHLAREILESA